MSGVDSILNRLGYDIDREHRDLNRKADLSPHEWTGAARNQFDKSHKELSSNAGQLIKEIDSMKRTARALEASIQAAERDIARKAMLADKK